MVERKRAAPQLFVQNEHCFGHFGGLPRQAGNGLQMPGVSPGHCQYAASRCHFGWCFSHREEIATLEGVPVD